MKYSIEQDPNCFDNKIIHLNGRRIPFPLECDTDEGWVEVLDEDYIARMAPCNTETSEVDDDEPQTIDKLAVKRLTGKVEIFDLNKLQS